MNYKAYSNPFFIRIIFFCFVVVLSLWAETALRSENWLDGIVVLSFDFVFLFFVGRTKVLTWDSEFVSVRGYFFGYCTSSTRVRWNDVKQIRYIKGISKRKLFYRYFLSDVKGNLVLDSVLHSDSFPKLFTALNHVVKVKNIPLVDECTGIKDE